ncbi:hypothetical protein [Nonomuraea sp. NPDC046570]|uniref:hypothetical protein n=1 Tax=Nonomuraea sp. NPDC046570 TaxID=3155255 RepID=UPI0033CE6F5F
MRHQLRTLAVAGVLGAALLVTPVTGGLAHAVTGRAAGSEARLSTPIGLWTGTVVFEGGQIEAKVSFHLDGAMCLHPGPPGPDGGVEGSGTWTRTGFRTFTFQGTERFFDGAGTTTGYLVTTHSATQRHNVFTGTGTATFYDAAWVQQGDPLTTASEMRRTQYYPGPHC